MRCPQCDDTENRVVDTRTSRGGRAVRRRRECLECGERFTTYEYVEARTIQVLKRDGSAEEFDREKLVHSLHIACAKRPVSASDVEALADAIGDDLSQQAGVEVASSLIGEMRWTGWPTSASPRCTGTSRTSKSSKTLWTT